MDKPKVKQSVSKGTLSGPEGDNVGTGVPAGDSGRHEMEVKTLNDELERLKELIGELKGDLIVLNGGIVARQDTIDQLTKRKRKLLKVDKDQTTFKVLPISINRKTTDGVLVDLMDSDLSTDAIEVFPEEIWELILGKLTDPKDIRNCSTSCQLFDKILHPLKPNFLFLGVFPHICTYLDNDLILACRRVCKGWNEGVDSFVENHPALLPCDKVGSNPRNPHPTTNGLFNLEFSNRRGGHQPQNFLEKMRDHPRNPFVGRAVSIWIFQNPFFDLDDESSDGEEDDWGRLPFEDEPWSAPCPAIRKRMLFRQALFDFIKVLGKHIWYLSFKCERNNSIFVSEASKFRFLRKIFVQTPNLRRIEINGYLPSSNSRMLETLPDTPKLETLKFVRESGTFGKDLLLKGSAMETLIHAYCQQLKRLDIYWAGWKHIFKSNIEWTNLTELCISISNDKRESSTEIECVVPSRIPQLRKIELTHHEMRCDFQTIMIIIIKLSARTNLQALRIFGGIERKQVLQATDCLFAQPNLKTLEIDRANWSGEYTLLLRFPFLENLIVHDKESSRMRSQGVLEREVVDLETFMFEGLVYECEIWEMLPRLKVFMVGREVYTRECYERMMAQKKGNSGTRVK